MLKQQLATLALALVARLPIGTARLMAGGLARGAACFDNDVHRITTINIELTHPGLESQAKTELIAKAISGTVATSLEMPIVWQRDNAWLEKKIVAVHGEEHLQRVLADQRGVLVICPHVGNWEVFGRYLPRHAPTTNLYQPPKYAGLEAMVKRGREQSGARLVPTSQRGIAQLLKALQRGEIVGMLPDQVPKNDAGVYADFLGVQAFTMTLVHKLIQRTGCKAVLGYALREANGFSIHFKPAHPDIYSEDQQRSVEALNAMVAMALEEDPAQYQWAYKRFKTLPDGTRPYSSQPSDK